MPATKTPKRTRNLPELVDLVTVAELIGVSTPTLRSWVAEKRFPEPTLKGRAKWLWSRRKLERELDVCFE
jgi:predicted DNA-binding transcriptional regulator AlpA